MNWFRVTALAFALVVPTAAICDDLIRFALSVDAHRCCASTGGECARLSTPDECCKTREQGASQGLTSVAPESRARTIIDFSPGLPVAFVPNAFAGTVVSVGSNPADPFKRPHDPPYLHPFPLLI